MTTILTADERAILVATLNRLIPARSPLPAAGDLGVPATIEATLARSPTARRLILDGLRAIAIAAGKGEGGFVALGGDERDAALRAVEAAEPAAFALIVEETYRGYYALPVVQRALGLSGEPPQPRGHRLPPFDPALLTMQRQRAPFWHRTDEEQSRGN